MKKYFSSKQLREQVIKALKTVYDPELPVDVYELGLIYAIHPNITENKIDILMTLTTPSCPVADQLPHEVKEAVRNLTGVENVQVGLTFDPPYSVDRLSETARLALDF